MQKPTGYAGGGKRASGDVSLQKSSYVLNCMQAVNHIQAKNKEERYMKNQNNDTYILAQGKYPWGIIKNRKLNSKFVKCSKGVFQNRTLPISMIVGSNLTEQLNCIRKYDKII